MSKSTKSHASNISDEQIIDLYFDRNEQAISETDNKYGGMLFTIAHNILCDPLDCEECKNDAYLGIWNAIPPSRPAMFSAFISKIMRNVVANRYRDKTRQKRIPSELTVSLEDLGEVLYSENSPEREYEAKELGKVIEKYIQSLTERQRFIFMERFYFVKTIDQIAKEYGIPSATINREISKIKQGLKIHLEENGVYL